MPIRPALPDELLKRPFTTAEGRRLGVSHTALEGSQWRHVLRDVWVHASVDDTLLTRVAAARLILGAEGFLCGLTAAWIYGVDVQDRRAALVWMGRPTGSWRRIRPGCLVREITMDQSDLAVVEEALVTTPLRTAFDCARWLSLTEAVVVADALAAAGRLTKVAFQAYVKGHRGLRGIRQADLVADLIEPLTESPMESRLRVLLITSGLPKPEPQFIVNDHAGEFIARVDFAYPDRRVIIEYDGSLHWDQRRADDRLRDEVRDLGWKVLVAGRSDYYEKRHAFLAAVRQALGPATT